MTEWQHRDARDRWATLSLAEQFGNIGSEISRAIKWSTRNPDTAQGALFRALDLFDLTLDDPRHRESPSRLREIARAREVVVDFLAGSNEYRVDERLPAEVLRPVRAVCAPGSLRLKAARNILETIGTGAIMVGGLFVDEFYFKGDPATDSTRRHLERVLSEPDRPRHWPWVTAAIAGAAALGVWQWKRRRRPSSEEKPATSSATELPSPRR